MRLPKFDFIPPTSVVVAKTAVKILPKGIAMGVSTLEVLRVAAEILGQEQIAALGLPGWPDRPIALRIAAPHRNHRGNRTLDQQVRSHHRVYALWPVPFVENAVRQCSAREIKVSGRNTAPTG